MARALDLKGK